MAEIGAVEFLAEGGDLVGLGAFSMFSDFLTSTGLQIKVDPGLKTVYFAFFLLMVSTYASFISYSQIYSFETELNIKLGGTSNRAILFFQKEFNRILNRILA